MKVCHFTPLFVMEDPWADVFAKAEGTSSPSYDALADSNGVEKKDDKRALGEQKKSPFSKSTKRRKRNTDKSIQLAWTQHLQSRGQFTSLRTLRENPTNDHVVLKERLIGGGCKGWKYGVDGQCRSCGQSSFRHRTMSAITLDKYSWPLHLYWSLRNLRYTAIIYILDNLKMKNVSLSRPLAEMKRLYSMFHETKTHYWDHIDEPWNDLLKQLQDIDQNKTSGMLRMLRLIISCDACYYKLYYADLTARHDTDSDPCFIPHPTFYLGEAYLSGDLHKVVEKCSIHSTLQGSDEAAMNRYNIIMAPELMLNEKEDALTCLHQIRFLETAVLFKVVRNAVPNNGSSQELWEIQTPKTGSKWQHETPAPPIVQEWRNSARDFLTHLYAYATIPSSHVDEIANFSSKSTIVELGAGTGYLAYLLRQRGVTVRALDCSPTQMDPLVNTNRKQKVETNKYHGATPSFSLVERGQLESFKRVFRELRQKKQTCTLLLSYPPPDSEMGFHALKAFVDMGGTKFVYIGEFQGLTGTKQLDLFLMKHGTQSHTSVACPTWGTDAANITFWTLDSKERQTSLPLIVCDRCRAKPACQRLRIMRYLHYCSDVCWLDHRASNAFRDHLVCAGLENHMEDVNRFSFGDPNHFLKLSF